MHAQELLEIFRFFSTKADEATGIPNYVYGSGQVGRRRPHCARSLDADGQRVEGNQAGHRQHRRALSRS
jgi:hypothetical protein